MQFWYLLKTGVDGIFNFFKNKFISTLVPSMWQLTLPYKEYRAILLGTVRVVLVKKDPIAHYNLNRLKIQPQRKLQAMAHIIRDFLRFPDTLHFPSFHRSRVFLRTTSYFSNFTLLHFLASWMCRNKAMDINSPYFPYSIPLSFLSLKYFCIIFLTTLSWTILHG